MRRSEEVWQKPDYRPYDRRHTGSKNYIRAYLRNSGTSIGMQREKHNGITSEAEYQCPMLGRTNL
ncbi:MAG: hypothetical protein PHI70_10080 [Proteiniphilum sp.]|nr:hypothetical protein [Proteiniphilum sp.]